MNRRDFLKKISVATITSTVVPMLTDNEKSMDLRPCVLINDNPMIAVGEGCVLTVERIYTNANGEMIAECTI